MPFSEKRFEQTTALGLWPEGGCLFIWDQAEAISVSSAYSLKGVASREGPKKAPYCTLS